MTEHEYEYARIPIGLAIEIEIHDILVFSARPRIMTNWSHKLHREIFIIGLVNKDKDESQSNFVPYTNYKS